MSCLDNNSAKGLLKSKACEHSRLRGCVNCKWMQCVLHSSETFESPYASLAKPVEGYTLTANDEVQLKQDENDMAIINGFLSNHH